MAGTVTALAPGRAPRRIDTDSAGHFKLQVPASGTLIFEAPGCEPMARRIFEHPRVRKALAALQTEQEGPLLEQLAKNSIFDAWKLLLSELDWQVSLAPAK